VQGTVMRKAFGFLDASTMNNCDALSVLMFGYVIGHGLYPWLLGKGIKVSTSHKFAFGSFLGALAILWALGVEYQIHRVYARQQDAISILWQAPSYILIGVGEIFCISSAYETAFTTSPPKKKALASAINIFCVGGIPNFVCLYLYHACSRWFENSNGESNIHTLERYTEACIAKYFWVLFGIAVSGVALNLLPACQRYVVHLEKSAVEAIKTPRMTPKTMKQMAQRRAEGPDEKRGVISSLLKSKKYQKYLKYGNPIIYRAGSMHAEPVALEKMDGK
jgi:POT family proton-dependent oligopeptide transporter